MAVKTDSGRRYVEVETIVPGTPDQVWRAIASGPGITSWFVPTTFEAGDDGVPTKVVSNFGPGMESVAEVTEWKPPFRMAATSADLGPDAPTIATEWIVEARDGGECAVRVVHSLFTSAEDWDNQLEGWESGWPDFFRILRLYLSKHADVLAEQVQLQATTTASTDEAWETLVKGMGLAEGLSAGDGFRAGGAAPELEAVVEHSGGGPGHPQELLVSVTEPLPGIAHLFVMKMGEQTYVSVRFYLYGGVEAPPPKERSEAFAGEWGAWLAGLFPAG